MNAMTQPSKEGRRTPLLSVNEEFRPHISWLFFHICQKVPNRLVRCPNHVLLNISLWHDYIVKFRIRPIDLYVLLDNYSQKLFATTENPSRISRKEQESCAM
jgi:hypothetical protein